MWRALTPTLRGPGALRYVREFDGRPEKSAYGLDHRGYTHTEAMNHDEKAPGRVLINRELERSREAYGRRERDEAGKVKSTVGRAFNFFGKSVSAKNAAKAAERRRSLAADPLYRRRQSPARSRVDPRLSSGRGTRERRRIRGRFDRGSARMNSSRFSRSKRKQLGGTRSLRSSTRARTRRAASTRA